MRKYANKFENLDKFHAKHKASSPFKKMQEFLSHTEYIVFLKNRTKQNNNNIIVGLDCFARKFFQICKEEILTNLHRISLNIGGKEILSTSFYE